MLYCERGSAIWYKKYRKHHNRRKRRITIFDLAVEEDNLNFRVKLDIEVQIVAKLPDKEYGDNEFSYREIYFMHDFDEYVDEDNIEDVLNKADEEINADIEEDQDKDSILGIQAFHFELIIIEDICY